MPPVPAVFPVLGAPSAGIVLILLIDRVKQPEGHDQNSSSDRPGQSDARHLGLL